LTTPTPAPSPRTVYLLQRKESRIGAGLGKTTGWVHRAALKAKQVHQLGGVQYDQIDDDGLHITVDGRPRLLSVDTVVVCAGQESVRSLADELPGAHVIGGADVAAELDAKRAIDQGTRLAAVI
jgi:2,4-dienoyl-CoA reductase (NADPH2)